LIPSQVQRASKTSPVFIVEGAIDALSLVAFLRMCPEQFAELFRQFKCRGRPIVVATGSATIFPEHLFEVTEGRVVFCAFDGDAAGNDGTGTLVSLLDGANLPPRVIRQAHVSGAKDWNEKLIGLVTKPRELDDDLEGCR